jgi:transcriptional regulator with XRE-family HTH domain
MRSLVQEDSFHPTRAGLTQQALARKMRTTQPVVARLESGRTRPSMRTLERLAEAAASRLLVSFEPLQRKRPGRLKAQDERDPRRTVSLPPKRPAPAHGNP